jgi:hypothetical protein
MSLLGWEDNISLSTCDRQRTLHILQLRLLHERRVSSVSSVELAEVRAKVAHNVFAAEAVAYCTNPLFTISIKFCLMREEGEGGARNVPYTPTSSSQ